MNERETRASKQVSERASKRKRERERGREERERAREREGERERERERERELFFKTTAHRHMQYVS